MISHEVPRCLLTASDEFNDYSYCLPHLMDEDEQYRQYFYDAKANGRYIVMDNSLHELGHAYDHDRLFYWMNEIKPNEFIVPDVWMDKTTTLVNAKYWKQYKYPKETTPVAVVQAKSYGEAVECYTILRDLKYRKIAFSYGADWYADLINSEDVLQGNFLNEVLKGLNKELPSQYQIPQGTVNSVITGEQSKICN